MKGCINLKKKQNLLTFKYFILSVTSIMAAFKLVQIYKIAGAPSPMLKATLVGTLKLVRLWRDSFDENVTKSLRSDTHEVNNSAVWFEEV